MSKISVGPIELDIKKKQKFILNSYFNYITNILIKFKETTIVIYNNIFFKKFVGVTGFIGGNFQNYQTILKSNGSKMILTDSAPI